MTPFMPTVSLSPDALVRIEGGEVVTWAECERRLLAARTPAPEGEVTWRDITTAPKDGTVFLARCGDFAPFECQWHGDCFVHMDPEDGPIAYKPDQWHPLNLCRNCNGFGFLDEAQPLYVSPVVPAPEGEAWRTVPVEPTEAMIEAAHALWGEGTGVNYVQLEPEDFYAAMLAASPVVPVGVRERVLDELDKAWLHGQRRTSWRRDESADAILATLRFTDTGRE